MHRVYKYELHPTDRPVIDMPTGAKLLRVDTQHRRVMVWALVEVGAPTVARRFEMVGTGHDVKNPAAPYLGTFFMGELVFHLFDLGERAASCAVRG